MPKVPLTYALAAAVRGPDSLDEGLKQCSTMIIRGKLFEQAECEGGWARAAPWDRVFLPRDGEGHFVAHITRAARALRMEVCWVENTGEVGEYVRTVESLYYYLQGSQWYSPVDSTDVVRDVCQAWRALSAADRWAVAGVVGDPTTEEATQ